MKFFSLSRHLFLYAFLFIPLCLMAFGNPAVPVERRVVFSETFDTQAAFDQWTIVDLNGGVTWRFFNNSATYLLDPDNVADDWIFSPFISLDADSIYELSFNTTVMTKPENFKVYVSTSNDPNDAMQLLADYPSFVSSMNGKMVLRIKVPITGYYKIAFYEYSEPNMHRIEIDNVEVANIGYKSAPDKVEDLILRANINGALTDTIRFKAPTISLNNEALSSISTIKIYSNQDSEVKKNFSNPAVGGELSWVDTNPLQGINTYYVFAENAFGIGIVDSVSVYVGSDIPVAVSNVNATLQPDFSVKVEWPAVAATINGGYLDESSLRYIIYRNGDSIDATVNTTYIDAAPVTTGQDLVTYKVRALTSQGLAGVTTSNQLIAGTPITDTYVESFSDGVFQKYKWVSQSLNGNQEWAPSENADDDEIESLDGDNGMFKADLYYSSNGNTVLAISPLFDLRSIGNPILSFYIYHNQEQSYDEESDGVQDDRMQVQVSKEGGAFENIAGAEFYYLKDRNGWTKCEIPLAVYKDAKFINLGFLGIADNGQQNLYIDSVSIHNGLSHDLIADSIVAPKRVDVNTTNSFEVYVTNRGGEDASSYTVTLEKDGVALDTKQGDALQPAEQAIVSFDVVSNISDVVGGSDSHKYRAYVSYASDLYNANDTTALITSSVRTTDYPIATNLSGKLDESLRIADITWNAAQSQAAVLPGSVNTITDDFESYNPFIIDSIGNWTMYDLDGGPTLISPRMPAYLHQGEPMAYQVFNNSIITNDDVFDAHSGNQYLIAPSARNFVHNNDWLVSPLLDGREQTISFWAKSASYQSEQIIVYYSTTDKHPDSFIKISDGNAVFIHEGWQKYEYTLPEGAKYFAVRYVSISILLFVDDITYNTYSGAKEELNVIGYNIYKDGVKLNNQVLTNNLFTDNTFIEGDKYAVTVVYDKGESALSEECIPTYNSDIQNDSKIIRVYSTAKNILIDGAEGNSIMVYGIDGKISKKLNAQSYSTSIPAERGVYIVVIGNQKSKVIVK